MLDAVHEWASSDEKVRLVVLTGSVARGEGEADSLSDLDLELFVRDPAPLLTRREWYESFGRVLVVEELENPDWHPTRLIYYVDAKIDFMIAEVDATKEGITYSQPFRVVIDKDGLADSLHMTTVVETGPPTTTQFGITINWFYAAALMCAKCIVRSEPWMAKTRDWACSGSCPSRVTPHLPHR